MKKWILAAALLFALSGFAAAQSTTVKAASKTEEKKAVKKGTDIKSGPVKKTDPKKDAEAILVKLDLPKMVVDTTAVPPKGKNDF